MAERTVLALPSSKWGDLKVTVPGTNFTANCEVNPVPNVKDLMHNADVKLLIGWIIAGACVAGSLVVVLHHLLQLRSFPDTARRRYMIGVVFAITNLLSMFFPRAATMFEVLQHVYEAQALFSFGALIFDLASDGQSDALVAKELLLAKLSQMEPKKLDASPPLCFLLPCVPAVVFDAARLGRIMRGISTFQIVVPVCAIIRLWVAMESKSKYVVDGSQVGLFLAENLAMSYTLYHLFQLYVSTHDIIHHFNPTAKFVAIKAILGIAVLQSMIIKVVVKKFVSKNSYFTEEFLSEFWSNFALCVESIFLALTHMQAYPMEELRATVASQAEAEETAHLKALELFAAMPQHEHSHEGKEGDDGDEESGAGAIELVSAHDAPAWTPGADEEDWPEEGAAVAGGRPAGAAAADAPAPARAPVRGAARIPAFSEPPREA